jgi:serine/threonine protein kinase
MIDEPKPRRGLLALAAEGVVPVLGGCAGALAGGPEAGVLGGMAGVAVGQTIERVINYFGARIVVRWAEWFKGQPTEKRQEALAELASLPPEEARAQASELLDQLALEPLSPADKEVAVSYLSLLPGALDRALPRDSGTGVRTLPPTISVDEPQQLLSLLPVNLPPYSVGVEVPSTPYRLEALLGSGGFGAVYRASTRSLQHLPLAIKFCLDPTLAQALHRERANLERLMKAGGLDWSPRVVRLYGYDLEHKTPYLVYEYVTGGDLTRHIAEKREQLGRALNPQEVLELIVQVAEALSFAHEHGLVHRDLKPANVLVESGVLKLADFGLGGVTAARAAQVSRIGATTVDLLSVADQASLFRGAGTPLYMAPEQRRGQAPDPRHDLYSLGVMWYQLLVGDVSRELHPGWAKELSLRFGVPKSHINLIDACVGWFDERPKNATELLKLIRELRDTPVVEAPMATLVPAPAPAPVTMHPSPKITQVQQPTDEMRRSLLQSLVKQLHEAHTTYAELQENGRWIAPGVIAGVAVYMFTQSARNQFLSFFFAILVGGAGLALGYLVRLGKRKEALEKISRAMQTLSTEFPDAVQSWGGNAILSNPELVASVATTMGLVSEEATEIPELPPMASGQRKTLHGRLREMGQKIKFAQSFGKRRSFPFLLSLFVGLVLGLGTAIGCYFATWGFKGPHALSVPFLSTTYTNASGLEIDGAVFRREVKLANATAALVGAANGLIVAILVTIVLYRARWYRMAMLGGLLVGAMVGAAVGGGLGRLHYYLRSPYSETVHSPKGFEEKYYNVSGMGISSLRYGLEERQTFTTSMVLGFSVGVVVMLAVMLMLQNWKHRRAVHAAEEADEEVRALADDYPAFVTSIGGAESLKQVSTIAELMRRLDPTKAH